MGVVRVMPTSGLKSIICELQSDSLALFVTFFTFDIANQNSFIRKHELLYSPRLSPFAKSEDFLKK